MKKFSAKLLPFQSINMIKKKISGKLPDFEKKLTIKCHSAINYDDTMTSQLE